MSQEPTRPEAAGSPAPENDRVRSGKADKAADLTDGYWHRLHPATPLLRGGIVLIAILGIVIANLRQRIVDLVFRVPDYNRGDPIDVIYDRGLVGWALVGVAVLLILLIGGFYLSWRMHSFRVGSDAVEVRSGLLSRTHRKARLDRIQGINISRSLFARIFGAAKLEISVAGQDANVQLAYLSSSLADGMRRQILLLASGVKAAEAGQGSGADGAHVTRAGGPVAAAAVPADAAAGQPESRLRGIARDRMTEFMSRPELDPDAEPPASVVSIPPGRLFGSLVLSGFTVFLLLAIAAVIVGASLGHLWVLIVLLPGLVGSASFYINRFTKSLRYSIAGTEDGVRVGFGLLSTSNETIPPGRIHAIEVMQPLMWRPFGWWQIRIDTAGHSNARGAAGQANTTILPVGDFEDVKKVLALILPSFDDDGHRELIAEGMASRGSHYITAPRQAAWLRPFSWRRTGYLISDGEALLRHGAVWRTLVIVPLARMQSVAVIQGPVRRLLGLAEAELHTVSGPVRPRLSVIEREQAVVLFDEVAAAAIAWAERDTTAHWRAQVEEVPHRVSEAGETASATEQPPERDERGLS